jgi:hypothetical protein
MIYCHNSENSELDLNLTYEETFNSFKPRGLWYEINGSWKEWCEKNDFPLGKYEHFLDTKDCNILKVKHYSELEKFNTMSHLPANFTVLLKYVNWKKVKELYDGIEFTNYSKTFDLNEPLWWNTIDVKSGCIWNLKNLKLYVP